MQLHLDFLTREFFSMSLQAATQHIKIYAPEAKEADRKEVRSHLRALLEKLEIEYVTEVSEDAHVKNIERIVWSVSRRHSGLLADGRFPVASAQKALNLYLKYLWCVGRIMRPQHCPIDAFVLRAANLKSARPWTKMATIEEYKATIEQLKARTDGLSLAEWELVKYNEGDA
jgi:hypothetical protein